MDRVAGLRPRERHDLFAETGARLGLNPAIVEKDFWVCWILHVLFDCSSLGRKLIFKGGTSLSKVYDLIRRFSEDVDLILDWREVVDENPNLVRTPSAQDRFNKRVIASSRRYLETTTLPIIQALVQGTAKARLSESAPDVIDVAYPASFPDRYLRPAIRLEIGPLAAWLPHARRTVTPYAAMAIPDQFTCRTTTVPVIRAERTFWEKLTILHAEAHRQTGQHHPARYSRHYYDVRCMALSPVKAAALREIELLAQVVAFKRKFYPSAWARYDLAAPGTLRLVPPVHVRTALERDYREMQHMVFGVAPGFEEILDVIATLEREVNRRDD